MNLVIDGIVFSLQRHGGISVYFHQLLHTLAAHDVPATCLLEGHTLQPVASGSPNLVMTRRSPRRGERYRKCRLSATSGVFHSSYYRQPDQRLVASVITVYDFVYERWDRGPRKWVHHAQKSAAIRSAQAVICISNSTRDDLFEFVGETAGQEVHVIHCGAGDAFRPLSTVPASVPFVLFVGQRGRYKNFDQLLRAMEFLPDLELHCVGGAPLTRDELAGLPTGVQGRIRYLGGISDEKLNRLYNTAACLVYPSLYEGFGIPVLEAMRAGCPVVSAPCKAVQEVGRDALTVVPAGDPRAMADGVLSASWSDRERVVRRGLELSAGCSWGDRHLETLALYRRLGSVADRSEADSSMRSA